MKLVTRDFGQAVLFSVALCGTASAATITQNPPRESYVGSAAVFTFGAGGGSVFTTFLNQAGATQGVLDCTLTGGYVAVPPFPRTLQGGESVFIEFRFEPVRPGSSETVNCTVDGVPAPQLGLPPGIVIALSSSVAVPVLTPIGILGLAFSLIVLGAFVIRRS